MKRFVYLDQNGPSVEVLDDFIKYFRISIHDSYVEFYSKVNSKLWPNFYNPPVQQDRKVAHSYLTF